MINRILSVSLVLSVIISACGVASPTAITTRLADRPTADAIAAALPAQTEASVIGRAASTARPSTATSETAIPTAIPPTPTPVTVIAPTWTPTTRVVPTLGPDGWKELAIIPAISPTTVKIYQRGVELGNNPQAFSKIGDCGSTPAWFLGDFDRGSRYYDLGDFGDLENVIQVFQGSFSRTSLAAKSGFNASSIFSPLWSDRTQCRPNEAPLACEYRVHRPVAAFIMLGSNDVFHPEEFEPQMRKIIEFSIENGVVPILSTKADNVEGDGSINATIARLAHEYDIPLWNYWRAVQSLPEQGLQEDQVHITWAPNRFSDPLIMQRGWPVRNLNALQILDAFWQGVSGQ